MGLRRRLLDQAGHPRGWVAPIIAAMLNRSNRSQNELAVAALAPDEGDDVLDIGFGGGVGLRVLLERVPHGRLAGAELSKDLLRRGRRKFAHSIRSERLELRAGRVESLPWHDASFDGVITVNTYYFWPDVDAGFAEMVRVLRPGGRAVVGVTDHERLPTFGFSPEVHNIHDPDTIAKHAVAGGFDEVDVRPQDDPRQTILIVAQRSTAP